MKKVILLILCFSMAMTMAACGGGEPVSPQTPENPIQETGVSTGETDGAANTDGTVQAMEAYTPSPVNLTPSAKNVYPYMGVTLELPEALLNAVLDNIVFMRSEDNVEYTDLGGDNIPMDWKPTPEHTVLHGGALELCFIPENVRNRTPHVGMDNPMTYEQYQTWLPQTQPMVRLDMFRKAEFQEELLKENGYAQKKKLAETEEYVYYLSWNESGEEQAAQLYALLPELDTHITIQEPRPVDELFFGLTTPETKHLSQAGAFQTTTLEGDAVDQSVFAEKKLTMVNLWTTWCGACISEMPDLQRLSEDLADMDAQIVSICCDTADPRGQVDEELLELAQQITQKTGVTFPTLIPDKALHEGLLKGAVGYPTTFFVDNQGNLVGEPVLGANSAEDWLKMAQERMAEVAE